MLQITQRWLNVEPPSATLVQHLTVIGSTPFEQQS